MSQYTKDPLFTAILLNDIEQIKRLKSRGSALSDEVKNALSINRLSKPHDEYALWDITCDFQCAVHKMLAEDFIKTIRALREEIGEPLFFMPAIWTDIKRIMFEDSVWECVLECFDNKMNKARTMRDIIKKDRADILAICAKHGWLSQPKKRDEMIEFASANGKTECLALLLDFKNRTADLAAEQAKADKELERELNAAPDSVAALKQIWSYKKQSDADRTSAQGRQQSDLGGTLIITGYKGTHTEVAVPERIGKDTVTAIGEGAFCPFAARIKPEIKEARKAVTKITLPDTVREIGRGAFWECEKLVSVNIPEGVEKIEENTFAECAKLERIVIPGSVKCIERRAFFGCGSLKVIEVPEGVELINESAFAMCKELTTLVLPRSLKFIGSVIVDANLAGTVKAVVTRGSVAEEYCKKHDIPYVYKEDKD